MSAADRRKLSEIRGLARGLADATMIVQDREAAEEIVALVDQLLGRKS